MEGLGSTSIWGLSKPLDLQNISTLDKDMKDVAVSEASLISLGNQSGSGSTTEPLRILLVGASDIRHAMKTASRMARKDRVHRPIHFYIMETQSTVLARHMLLLSLIMDPPPDLSLQERAELFLECFSNLMVREKTAKWITEKASDLIRVITDGKGPLASWIDFSALKFRERDDLEFVFKFWRDPKKSFDGPLLWDHRVRSYLKRRYDSRENIYDWDYNMKLLEREKEATIIHKTEYTRWRMHGNAHEIRESHYEHVNRTMATVDTIKQDGLNVGKWGLFSDILVGPFICFSVDSEHKQYLQKANDKHQYPCQVIAEMNVKSMMHEMSTGCLYLPDEKPALENSTPSTDPEQDQKFIPLENTKFFFLPCDPQETFVKKKQKYSGFFDTIVFSSALAHRLSDSIDLLKSGGNGCAVVEGARMMLDLTVEQVVAYRDKVDQMAQEIGLKKMQEFNDPALNFSVFIKP